jgi:anti-sigma B factor antagonist
MPRLAWATDEINVVTMGGRIDDAAAWRLERALAGLEPSRTGLVLDMTEVSFLGTAGLMILADTAARLRENGELFAIVIGERFDAVLHAIEQTSVHQDIRLFDTVDHALAAATRRLQDDDTIWLGRRP